jgi:hypothetical protein
MNCPHEPCLCRTPDGGYCGAYCQEMTEAAQAIRWCECGHPECVDTMD